MLQLFQSAHTLSIKGNFLYVLPWLVRLLIVLRYVGMHTYQLNVLCFKDGIADFMLAKQINKDERKCF